MSKKLLDNRSHKLTNLLLVEEYKSFCQRFMGLTPQRTLSIQNCTLIVASHQSQIGASIHSLFMSFDLAAIGSYCYFKVIDARIVQRWRLAALPAQPARFVLENHTSGCEEFSPGDQVEVCYV